MRLIKRNGVSLIENHLEDCTVYQCPIHHSCRKFMVTFIINNEIAKGLVYTK